MKKKLSMLITLTLHAYTLYSQPLNVQNKIYYHAGNKTGWTLIHRAAAEGNVKVLEMYRSRMSKKIKNGLNQRSANGATPLYLALAHGRTDAATMLVKNGAHLKGLADSAHISPLHLLAYTNNAQAIEDVFSWYGHCRNIVQKLRALDANSETPHAVAYRCTHFEALHIMLKLLSAYNEHDVSPLFLGLVYGYVDYVLWRASVGDDADQLHDSFGHNPIHIASAEALKKLITWNKALTDLVIDINAAIDSKNNSGQTPLMAAAVSGEVEKVKILIHQGADLYATDHQGCNIFRYALFSHINTHELFELLSQHWSSAKDPYQATPVHYAVMVGNKQVVQLALTLAPDQRCARNKNGETPLFLALLYGYTDIADILARTTDPASDLINNDQLTPLNKLLDLYQENVHQLNKLVTWIQHRGDQFDEIINL